MIDLLAFLNICSDRKVASPAVIAKRSLRTGDGSKYYDPHFPEPEIWENKNKGDIKSFDELNNNVQGKDEKFPDINEDNISDVPEILQPTTCEYEFYSNDVVRKCK